MTEFEAMARREYEKTKIVKKDKDRLRHMVRYSALVQLSKGATPKIEADLWPFIRGWKFQDLCEREDEDDGWEVEDL